MSVVTALQLPGVDGSNPCATQGGAICGIIRHITNDPDLSGTLKTTMSAGSRIILIIVVALIVRAVLNRVIDRVVHRTMDAPSLVSLPASLPRRRQRQQDLDEGAVEGTVTSAERRRQRAQTIGTVLHNGVSLAVGSIAFIEILGALGVNLAPIIASAGIVGLALGFGAQNLVKDFLSGIFMILEDQYGVGDVVDLGVGDANGTVESVGLRITRLRDIKGQVWHVRNGEVVRVANKSQGWSRAVLDIPVAYGHDVAEASAVIKQVADDLWHDPDYAGKVLTEPDVLGVQDLGADAVTIRLSVKTEPLAQWDVARQLRARIKAAFDEHGLEIPYKQHSIWVRSDDSSSDGNAGAPDDTDTDNPSGRTTGTSNGRRPTRRKSSKAAR